MPLATDLAPLIQLASWLRRGPSTGGAEQREAAERFVSHVNLPPRKVPPPSDKATARLLYLHGGGLVHYRAATFEPLLNHWRAQHALSIEAIDYPHAPEVDVPDIVQLVVMQIAQRLEQAGPDARFVLVGDSIGGYLALQSWRRLRDARIIGIGLVYPVLDLLHETQSYEAYGRGFTLDRSAMSYFKSLWTKAYHRPSDLRAVDCPDFTALPKVYVATAGCDVLRDEAFEFCAHLDHSGVDVRHECFEQLPHDFCLFAGRSPSCLQAVNRIGDMLAALIYPSGTAVRKERQA